MPTPLDALPEVFVSTTETSAAVSRALADGALVQLGPKLYTKNLTEDPQSGSSGVMPGKSSPPTSPAP